MATQFFVGVESLVCCYSCTLHVFLVVESSGMSQLVGNSGAIKYNACSISRRDQHDFIKATKCSFCKIPPQNQTCT